MAVDEGLVAWVGEALEPLGTVTMRRMMGGAVLYLDGTTFAIVHDGELWLKADAESNAIWDEAGHIERFTITFKTGMVDSMNYRRAPSETYDDADALREWAGLAIAAGQRAPKKKPRARKG
ncbi:TfoX/Sxy family protein [Sphingomonas sp. HITSZ_GF]|uniref:TfoX/Sxy family protein n=1 Tax=Sphingomonas sp. HITSZ_GF TaxID=3037247 RepID=UPI00240E70EF|nr:TfoX/Sxy family protein [Sphingomonas sp. HITSZ_GF]MDG2534659.1 TfoX/Sxy family protein [Sphingomonas sp. HITSZ_GF]